MHCYSGFGYFPWLFIAVLMGRYLLVSVTVESDLRFQRFIQSIGKTYSCFPVNLSLIGAASNSQYLLVFYVDEVRVILKSDTPVWVEIGFSL